MTCDRCYRIITKPESIKARRCYACRGIEEETPSVGDCFLNFVSDPAWQSQNLVKTVDQGSPEPAAFEDSGFCFARNPNNPCARIGDRIPNASDGEK